MWEEVSGEQVEFDGLLIDTLLARGPQKADIATLGGDEIRACVKGRECLWSGAASTWAQGCQPEERGGVLKEQGGARKEE